MKVCSLLLPLMTFAAVIHPGAMALPANDLPPAKPLKIPVIKYDKFEMANGLEVLTCENHRLPLVAIDLWYHVGPVNEKAGRTGFAHLFEHMMFEGSEHVGEKAHFKYLEGAGATGINGTTSFDRTNYFETLPSNQLELGLWLESDRMGFLLETLDRVKLTNQRDVVRNERRQGEGAPYELADEEGTRLLFPKTHPYYADVIGSHADIEAARLADVRDFFQHYYTPNNASIAIVGDFDPAQLKALLEKYFGAIPKGPAVDKVAIKTPVITSERRAVVTDSVQLPRVSLKWLTPPAFQPGDSDAQLFLNILGSGKSSRLYRKLVYEQQIAQSVQCDYQPQKLASIAGCDITARPGVQPEALELAINKEIEALRTAGPSEAEVNQARNGILTDKISGLQRLGGFGGVADMLDMYNQYLGDPGYLPKDIARYQDATVASVQKVGEKNYAKNQRVVVYTVSGKKVVNDVPRSPDDTDAEVKIVNPYKPEFEAQQDWRKTQPAAGKQPDLTLPAPKTFALANGAKVYLVEEHALPIVNATFINLAGSAANPADKPGLAYFTARMLTEGTANRTSTQLASDAASIGTTLNSIADMDHSVARIGALSNHVEAALDLLSDVALHPAFQDAEVERIRTENRTAILQEGDDPISATFRVGFKALYGDSPYGYVDIGTTASVNSVTRGDLSQFWSSHYAPKSSALVLSGDITEQDARKLAEQYFGTWTAGNQSLQTPIPAPPPAAHRKIVVVDKPGAPQTALFAFGYGVPRATPDYPAVNVMNSVLGGLFSSRINMNLREKNGYTYGAFAGFLFYRDGGPFYSGASVRTDITGPAARELLFELNRIRTEPPTTAELKLATDNALRSLPGDFETVRQTSALIGELFTYDLSNNYYQTLPSEYLKLTPDAVEKTALDYVHPEALVIVAVGDRGKIEPGLQQLNLGPIEIRDESGDLIKK